MVQISGCMDRIAKSLRKRRGSDHFEVVAATAGKDSWKTWAGRTNGDDEFQPLDLARGMKRKFSKRFLWTMPKAGTACPICLCEPTAQTTTARSSTEFFHDEDEEEDITTSSNSDELWYIMSSCGHAVCYDCLRAYAENQVKDPDHVGPLKCPVCSLPLREKDAIAALQHDNDLIEFWDKKIRDQFLRALPNYRQCPHCCNKNKKKDRDVNSEDSSFAKGGGGFVTPRCLGPTCERRKRDAVGWLNQISNIKYLFLASSFLLLRNYLQWCSSACSGFLSKLFYILVLPVGVIFQTNIYFVCRRELARMAKCALLEPIIVECPCCDEEFILNTEAELNALSTISVTNDKASMQWIRNHTRPCPNCSVPISKNGGCNSVYCTGCRKYFCWKCMGMNSDCSGYNCSGKGATTNHGSSSASHISGDVIERTNKYNGGRIIDAIHQMESVSSANRHTPGLFAGFTLIASIVVLREMQLVRTVAKVAAPPNIPHIRLILLSFTLYCIVFLFITGFLNQRQQQPRRQDYHRHHQDDSINDNKNIYLDDMTEEEMIAEAKARSLQIQ